MTDLVSTKQFQYLKWLANNPTKVEQMSDEQIDTAMEWVDENIIIADAEQNNRLSFFKSILMESWLMRGKTLRKAQAETMEKADAGTVCPCCSRYVKRYGRLMNSTRARAAIWLVGLSGPDRRWVHIPTEGPRWMIKTNQTSTLLWWGLTERKPTNKGDQGNSHLGWYRPTQRGIDFVKNNGLIPKKLFMYNGEVFDRSDELISVGEAIGEKFNLTKEMEKAGAMDTSRQRLTLIKQ